MQMRTGTCGRNIPGSSVLHPNRFAPALVALSILFFTASGCHFRTPRPTGYLPVKNYETLQRRSVATGVFADRLLHPVAATSRQRQRPQPARVDHVVQVLPSRWEGESMDPEIEQELLTLLNLKVSSFLLDYTPPTVLVTRARDVDAYVRAGANVTQLRLAITDVEKGLGVMRFLVGFRIWGVKLQVEGQLVDARTGQVLVNFARRASTDGTIYGLPSPQMISSRWTARRSITESAQAIALYVAEQLKAPPVGWIDKMGLAGIVPEEHRKLTNPKLDRPNLLMY